MGTMSDLTDEQDTVTAWPATSRRALLRAAAKLPFVAPLALGLLQPGTALADNDQEDTGPGLGPGRGLHLGRGNRLGRFPFPFAQSRLTLVPVGSVNGGTSGGDFGASNPGSDGLSAGAVVVGGSGNHQVWVSLQGAVASAGYDVQFERLQDHGREDLGTVSTDGNGNFRGLTPNALGGSHRVGCFVLIRNVNGTNQDEYVTVLA